MLKHFYDLLACTFLICCMVMPVATCAQPDQKLHIKCLYPVIQVTPHDKPACGSGVIVRSVKMSDGIWHNVFLSCAHVADSPSPYVVRVFHYEKWSSLKGSDTYDCKFYATDSNKDLAIGVFVTAEEMPTSEIDFATDMYIGTDTFRIGCGLGDEPRLDNGKVTSVRSNMKSLLKGTIRTSVHTLPGDSGAPLFHDYKIIGIMQAIRSHGGQQVYATSYAIPVERLKTWDDETEGALNFAWRNKQLPKMPFYQLKMEQYEVIKSK